MLTMKETVVASYTSNNHRKAHTNKLLRR